MTKICCKCKQEKPNSEFNKNKRKKDGLQTYCRPCSKEKNNYHYKNNDKYRARIKQRRDELKLKNRDIVFEHLKSHPCIDCGEPDPILLEFDHVRGTKIIEISRAIYSCEITKLLDEISKCDIRCANCHKRKTAKDFGWWIDKIASNPG